MRAALSLLFVTLLPAQSSKLAEPYRSLVDLAQATPPEFSADALLRVAESGKIQDGDAVRDLVEQAFRTAAAAMFRVRMRSLPGTTTDTRSGVLGQASDLKLDALSLQTRAVRDMLAIDKTKARDLFRDIQPPLLVPLACDDPMVYDVGDFYQTLGQILNTAFSDKERAKEQHVNFLLDYIGQVSSPAQLAPLARMIENVNVAPAQSELLMTKFKGIQQNTQTCKGALKLERLWQSGKSKDLLQQGLKLRIAADGHLLTVEERSSPEWQDQLTSYLNELADWTAAQDQSEAVLYHEKCLAYEALLELIPPSLQRDKVLLDFVSFVTNSDLQRQRPPEWYVEARAVLDRVRYLNDGTASKLVEAYRLSGNPILALEIALDQEFGTAIGENSRM